MHHAPAGPPLSTRLVALVRRARLLPLTLAGLVVVGLALAAPPSAGGERAGTAALTSPSLGERELVPATGDGWTQDGRPPATTDGGAPAGPAPGAAEAAPDPGTTAPSGTASSSEAGAPEPSVTAPDSPSPAAVSPAGTPSTSAAAQTSTTSTPSPSPSSSVPSSGSSATPAPDAVVAGAADEALAAVNAARTAAGCEDLTAEAELAEAATAHSTGMRDQAALLTPPGTGAVVGGLTDPAAVAAGWQAEAGATLTDCALTTAGVGVVDGWWTLLVA